MWFGADFLPHSHALPPRSPLRDINPAAVSGRALTFSRCTEVVLCRQISPRRKIHRGRGGEAPPWQTLEFSRCRWAMPLFAQDDPSWGDLGTMGEEKAAKQRLIPGEWDGGSGKGEAGRGEPGAPPLCEPRAECSVMLPAPSLPCPGWNG